MTLVGCQLTISWWCCGLCFGSLYQDVVQRGSAWRIFEDIRIVEYILPNMNIKFFCHKYIRIFVKILRIYSNILSWVLLSWLWINTLKISESNDMGTIFEKFCDRGPIERNSCGPTGYFFLPYQFTNPTHLDLDKYSYKNIRIFEYFAWTNIFVFVFGSNLIFRIYLYSYSFKIDISNIFDIRIRCKKEYSSHTAWDPPSPTP